MLYVGQFGLGHRLSKLSAAYDLAQKLNLPLQVHWGSCQSVEIFEYLFQSNILIENNTIFKQQDKIVLVRNDVLGYYAGQSYKNAHVALTSKYSTATTHVTNPWLQKWQQDYRLFTSLLQRFSFQDQLQDFQQRHEWNKHHVIGLHLRAGNGEQDHFQQADRQISNPATFLQHTSQLLHQLIQKQQSFNPLIFVATDTSAWIPFVRAAFAHYNIPVIAFPQPRLHHNEGVSYARWTQGQACLDGWKYSMMDMALMSQCDTVVAAMRSTFTQILPLSIVMSKDSHVFRYCEVSTAAHDMTCFRDSYSWLFRTNESGVVGHFSLNNASQYQPVMHKVMVHFPDVQEEPKLQDALHFLQSNDDDKVFAYGERINTKYRGKAFRQFTPNWTFAD